MHAIVGDAGMRSKYYADDDDEDIAQVRVSSERKLIVGVEKRGHRAWSVV